MSPVVRMDWAHTWRRASWNPGPSACTSRTGELIYSSRLPRPNSMLRKILIAISVLISIPVLLFLTAWLYPRPVDTTPPWVFESDGSELNYCDLPELDGSGLKANDIPRAYTPGCGYTQYPQPILRGCTEPLTDGAQDLRGLWQSVSPELPDHVERVEQCGDRVVVTTLGSYMIIHRQNLPSMSSQGTSAHGRFAFARRMQPPSGKTTSCTSRLLAGLPW